MGIRLMIAAIAMLALGGCEGQAAKVDQTAAVEATPAPETQPMTAFHIEGTARDGDDIQVSIRMHGFDTPELNAPHCRDPSAPPDEQDVNVAHKARDALRAMIRDRQVDCVLIGYDQQNERMVARCSVGDVEIGRHMVSEGWARDWTYFSEGRYQTEEDEARRLRRGVWSYECPANVWRRDYTQP